MGMYNSVQVLHPVRGLKISDQWLQTKDVHPLHLDQYTITREGKLIFHQGKSWWVKEQFPYKWVEEKDIELEFTGEMDLLGDRRQIRATFASGSLVKIVSIGRPRWK
jgi:hypothetical protein